MIPGSVSSGPAALGSGTHSSREKVSASPSVRMSRGWSIRRQPSRSMGTPASSRGAKPASSSVFPARSRPGPGPKRR